MKSIRTIGVPAALGIAALTAAGCGDSSEPAADNIRVGVVYYDQSDTFLGALTEALREDLAEYKTESRNITMMLRTSEGSQDTQNEQVSELIEAGCNVLCINLVDRSLPSDIIDMASQEELPIIFFNREPVAEDMELWEKTYYVGADARQSGQMQGELAAETILNKDADRNHDGVIQYVVLEGEAGHQDAIVRTESSVETIENEGIVLEKLSYQMANWNRAQAQNRVEQLEAQFTGKIELILANNDDMALGAVDAYEKLNYTENTWPLIFGVDGTDAGLAALQEGKIDGTVYNDKEGQAAAIARLAVAAVTGEGMDEISFDQYHSIYIPYFKITEE
ncbi:MAG: galactose ABC transporter substrate-binding protein [Lachnospiraceae bacterium]|nr:galactose ABC transporter substrate-binding protein [Lachnospiraceae bacterium]